MKELKINDNPLITVYPGYAAVFSIVEYTKEFYNWFASHYNSFLMFDKGDYIIYDYFSLPQCCTLSNYHYFSHQPYCPFITSDKINLSHISLIYGASITESLKKYLDNNCYLMVNINIKHISEYDCDYDYNHDLLIYGYDSEHFLIKDFFRGFYQKGLCSFEELEQALVCSYDINSPLNGFQQFQGIVNIISTKNIYYQFDQEELRYSLLDYLEPERNKNIYNKIFTVGEPVNPNRQILWGNEVWNFHEQQIIEAQCNSNYKFDYISSFIHSEHIRLFRRKLCNFITDFSDTYEIFDKLEKNIDVAIRLILKYNIKPSQKIIDDTAILIAANKNDIRDLYEALLNKI